MATTVMIEVPAEREALVRRLLALSEELEQLALSAPDGTVFDACETAVVRGGRDLSSQILADTVARRIETAEKRGRRSVSANAVAAKKTAAPRAGNS
jgi:hypothetical protein